MKAKIILLLCAMFSLNVAANDAVLKSDTVEIAFGDHYHFDNYHNHLYFDSVAVYYPRCLGDLNDECEVLYEVRMVLNHGAIIDSMTMFLPGTSSPNDTVIGRHRYELIGLSPTQTSDAEINPKNYKIKVAITDLYQNKSYAEVMIMKVDYETRRFESGRILTFGKSSPKFTVKRDYKDPGDFGYIKLYHAELDELIFHGDIIWAGTGAIIFPTEWIPAERFDASIYAQVIYPPNGFERITHNDLVDIDPTFDYKSIYVDLSASRIFLSDNPNQKVKVLLYTPSVGPGDTSTWKWIFFLYRYSSSGTDDGSEKISQEKQPAVSVVGDMLYLKNEGSYSYIIYNVAGSPALAGDAAGGSINISGLRGGVYIIRYREHHDGGKAFVQKFVKK